MFSLDEGALEAGFAVSCGEVELGEVRLEAGRGEIGLAEGLQTLGFGQSGIHL